MSTTSGRRQHGVTLIELMIGLTVSMIVVLGMLAVFKTTTFAAANAGRAASTDRMRLSGFYTAQKILVGAGYGIDVPTMDTDLILLSNATLGDDKKLTGTPAAVGGSGINAVLWGAKSDLTHYTCQGLYAPATGGLIRLAEVSCTSSATYASLVWTPISLIDDRRADYKVQMSATKPSGGCQSFGIAGSGSVAVTLETVNSIEGTNRSVATTACLLNFQS